MNCPFHFGKKRSARASYLRAKFHDKACVLLQMDTTRCISLTVSKYGIIFINLFHLKFRLVNCLSISWPLEQLSEVSVRWCSQGYLLEKFLQIIIKTPVAKFVVFSKVLWNYHIILNTNIQKHPKYEPS